RWARVVLPVPGGPHRIADSGPAAPPCPSMSRRSGDPGRSAACCPATSSILRGRIRTASGGRRSPFPAPASPASNRSAPPLATPARLPSATPCQLRRGDLRLPEVGTFGPTTGRRTSLIMDSASPARGFRTGPPPTGHHTIRVDPEKDTLMTQRLRLVGIMLMVFGLVFLGGAAVAFSMYQDGRHSLQSFSEVQGVELSYNDQ